MTCGDDWTDEGIYRDWTCEKSGVTYAMDMLPSYCPGCGGKA